MALLLFATGFALSGYAVYLLSEKPKPQFVQANNGISFTQENFNPQDPRWVSALRVIISTDKQRRPVQLLIVCDGPIGLAPTTGKFDKSGIFVVESQGFTLPSHQEVWNVKWRQDWNPRDRVTFELLSATEIHAKVVVPISYNPNKY